MEMIHQLAPHLRRLKLSGVLDTLERRNQEAVEKQIGYLDFLGMLLLDEVERRNMLQLQRRLKKAGSSMDMTLESFDYGFNPTINRQQVRDLASGDFITRKENVFFVGPSGVGKTHLASALAHEACRKGFDVLFLKCSQALRHLQAGRADGSWEARLSGFLKPDLLILDDWGLKPFDRSCADDLYEIISERYEKGSLMITSNLDLKEWLDLFQDPLLASAAMDRLIHHAHILTITGASYRARNKGPNISKKEKDG